MSLTSYRAAPPRVKIEPSALPGSFFCCPHGASRLRGRRAAPPRVNSTFPQAPVGTFGPLGLRPDRPTALGLAHPASRVSEGACTTICAQAFKQKPAPGRCGTGFVGSDRVSDMMFRKPLQAALRQRCVLPALKTWRRLTLPHLKMQYHQR